tara:strand:- start:297 stop:650 length:354 start_codon:yes stop_codon:yes gene_type:complete
MADIESSFTIPDAGLELFTDFEARELVITLQNKIAQFGDHLFWEFEVTDSNGNTYKWKDFSVAADADKATIKAAIYHHAVNNIYKVPDNASVINKEVDSVSHKVRSIISDKGLNENL